MFAPILSILLASSVLATPTTSSPKIAGCSASKKTLSMPSGQTQLVVPNTTTPTFIGIGVGVQNYTCGSTGTFTNVGAVAELFDISCADESVYGALTDITSAIWQAAPKSVTTQDIIKTLSIIDPVFDTPLILGQHFFVTNPTTGVGLSPEWNFASASLAGHSGAFVIGAKVGDIASPTSPSDIDWLMLNKAEGDLASQIFRVETRGGQPPASCTPGSPEIEVKYVSQYWLFGGSFTH